MKQNKISLLAERYSDPLTQIVTAAEWAKLQGVSPQYIRRICAQGKLNARKTEEGVWLIVKPEK